MPFGNSFSLAALKIDFSTKIEENTKQIAQINNQISESKLTLKYQSIKSPLDGVVFDLKPEAPGFVVNTQEPILKIVPTDDVVARVFISNEDIAFMHWIHIGIYQKINTPGNISSISGKIAN